MRLANLVPVAVAAALLATVGVIYVARGGGDSLDPVAAAATKTAGAGGYHLSIDADFTAAGRHVTVIGDGVADPAAQRAELTMRLAGSLTPAAPANAATDLVMTGDVMYMKVPTASGALGGKSWLKLDLSKVTNVGTNAQPVQQLDPTQWLQALRASAGVRRVGTDTVQGEHDPGRRLGRRGRRRPPRDAVARRQPPPDDDDPRPVGRRLARVGGRAAGVAGPRHHAARRRRAPVAPRGRAAGSAARRRL
jgi:hypothetical protein